MLVLDYLIANTDRHFGNFGIIRNIEDLDTFYLAPIFDSGTSMYLNFTNEEIGKRSYSVKPFYEDKDRQIKLVNLEKYNFSKLKNIEDLIIELYSKNNRMESDNPERKFRLAKAVKNNVKELEILQEKE